MTTGTPDRRAGRPGLPGTDAPDPGVLATGGGRGYLRIATEEAFAPPELIALWRTMLERGTCDDPGFLSMVGFYTSAQTERTKFVFDRLQDLGELRLADMDAAGVDRQIVSLTAPGTQILDRDDAVAMATLANACRIGRSRWTLRPGQPPGVSDRLRNTSAIAPSPLERQISRGGGGRGSGCRAGRSGKLAWC
jgi:hypothetical protein